MVTALTALQDYFNITETPKGAGDNFMRMCIYGCGASHREDWGNKADVTIAGKAVTLVACDHHPAASFKSDVARLVKAGVSMMCDLAEAEAKKSKVTAPPTNGE